MRPDLEETISIFRYESIGKLVKAVVSEKKKRDCSYSYSVLAKCLGVKSRSLIGMIAREERTPSQDLTESLCDYLQLSEEEKEYAVSLLSFARAKRKDTKRRSRDKIKTTAKIKNTEKKLDLSSFSSVGQWYHYAILELSTMPTFRDCPNYIAEFFGPCVTPEMARNALDQMEVLGLLKRDEFGVRRKAHQRVQAGGKVPSEVVRRYHRQMLMKASVALDAQGMERRLFTGMSIPIPTKMLPLIRQKVTAFRESLAAEIVEQGIDNCDSVYHLAIQFFDLGHQPSSQPRKGEVREMNRKNV